MSAFGINVELLYSSMMNTEWPENWKAREAYVMNIPVSQLAPRATLFADIQSDATHTLVRLLAAIVSHPNYTRSYQPANGQEPYPYYFEPSLPTTVQYIELLKSTKGELMGYRLWVFVLDPELCVSQCFHKIIEENRRRKQKERTQTNQGSGGGRGQRNDAGAGAAAAAAADDSQVVRPGDIVAAGNITDTARRGYNANSVHAPEQELMSVLDLVRRVWSPFTMSPVDNHSGNIHAMFSSQAPLTEVGMQFHPQEALKIESAMTRYVSGVDPVQCNILNYFPPGTEMLDPTAFRGKFPDNAEVYHLHTTFFTPNMLRVLPLPDKMSELMKPVLKNYMASARTLDARLGRIDEDRLEPHTAAWSIVHRDADNIRRMMDSDHREFDEHFMTLVRASPSMRMGASTHNLMDGISIDEIVADRNAFMNHTTVNTRIFEAVKSELPRDTMSTANHKTFCDAMQEKREHALAEFWRTFVSAPRERITQTVASSRHWFKGLDTKNQWVNRMRMFRDLSPFGNMVARMTNDFDMTLQCETNFQLLHLTNLVVLSAYRFWWELHPNLLITGDHSTGKSWVVQEIEKLCIPSAVFNVTHITKQAFQTDQDMSDTCYVQEETPLATLGADQYGNEQAADPYVKNRLTRQASTTMSPEIDKETGQRRVVVSFNRCMSTNIFISNDMLPADGPAQSRMMHFHMRRRKRGGAGGNDSTLSKSRSARRYDPEMARYHAGVVHGFQLHNHYLFVWEKAIESNALGCDIDVDTARTVMRWVFDDLRKHGISEPDRRHEAMCLDLCRTMTMYYGVEMEFFSEFARAARGGEDVEFDPAMIEGLTKWGVCTQEIAVFVISLMEFLWIPEMRGDVVSAMRTISAPLSEGANGKWDPVHASKSGPTRFRKEYLSHDGTDKGARAQRQQQQRLPQRGQASGAGPAPKAAPHRQRTKTNYHYVELRGATDTEIAARLAEKIAAKPSAADVMSQLKAMTTEFVDSQPHHFDAAKNWVPVPGANKKRIALAVIDNLPDAVGGQRKRVSIAVPLMDSTNVTLLGALEKVLCYKGQRRQKMITGSTYRHGIDKEPMYNVFDCIEVRPTDEPNYDTDGFGSTAAQLTFVANANISVADDASAGASVAIDEDLDYTAFIDYYGTNGLNLLECFQAFAPATNDGLWTMRYDHPEWNLSEFNGDYPHDWAETLRNHRDEAENLNQAASVRDASSQLRRAIGSDINAVDIALGSLAESRKRTLDAQDIRTTKLLKRRRE